MADLKILVVDDEARMRKLVKDFLTRENYIVKEAADGEEAIDIFFEDNDIDLVILDVMMPKMDGWEVCKEIRQFSKVPIIMLTAKGEESDELLGFDLGVDEYISKPFSPKILVARVNAILRRTNNLDENETLSAGDIEVNQAAHTVTVKGKSIELSFKEFELLEYFIKNKGTQTAPRTLPSTRATRSSRTTTTTCVTRRYSGTKQARNGSWHLPKAGRWELSSMEAPT